MGGTEAPGKIDFGTAAEVEVLDNAPEPVTACVCVSARKYSCASVYV